MIPFSTALKAISAAVILSTSTLGYATPPKLSVCPPVIGERDMMLSSVSNVGTQKRYGELCKVPSTTIQRNTAKSLEAFRPCLAELGVKELEITDALKSGEPQAEVVFNRSDNKELLCEKTRKEFK